MCATGPENLETNVDVCLEPLDDAEFGDMGHIVCSRGISRRGKTKVEWNSGKLI